MSARANEVETLEPMRLKSKPPIRPRRAVREGVIGVFVAGLGGLVLCFLSGCPVPPEPPVWDPNDPTNSGAAYIGSAACSACHPNYAEPFSLHGHGFALNRILGGPPTFPDAATRADVPNPPAGKNWTDVSYVISGYTHSAFFVDVNGFVMTDGVDGVNTQWNLEFLANGTVPGFVAYKPGQVAPLPYEYSCFRCHTTGSKTLDPNQPEFQDGRPGILGTWNEPGVRCEACHGPGSNHIPNPSAGFIFISNRAADCGRCHSSGDDPNVILAEDGYIHANTQWPQLLASGGHSGFDCTFCHNPHASIFYDSENGRRNTCTDCHTDVDMAMHEGHIFVRGDYVEFLRCESCHMPFVARSGTQADAGVVGPLGRAADTRTHIFRIDASDADYTTFFSGDGTHVVKDDQGRAAVTLDFVCLRCHNGLGSAFAMTVGGAASVASGLHDF